MRAFDGPCVCVVFSGVSCGCGGRDAPLACLACMVLFYLPCVYGTFLFTLRVWYLRRNSCAWYWRWREYEMKIERKNGTLSGVNKSRARGREEEKGGGKGDRETERERKREAKRKKDLPCVYGTFRLTLSVLCVYAAPTRTLLWLPLTCPVPP